MRDVIVLARLAALWTIAMSLTGEDLKGTAEVAIPEPPYHARFEHLVPPLTYGRPTNRIVLRAEALDVPLIMADPVALRLAREHCEKALDSISSGGRLVRTVRQLLSKPDGGFLDLEEAAEAVHMSPSTLKRRLMLQGYSLSMLLQEERRDRALLLLRSSALSIDDVADRLGYSSVQNFARAFRRWTGSTPGGVPAVVRERACVSARRSSLRADAPDGRLDRIEYSAHGWPSHRALTVARCVYVFSIGAVRNEIGIGVGWRVHCTGGSSAAARRAREALGRHAARSFSAARGSTSPSSQRCMRAFLSRRISPSSSARAR